MQIGHNQVDLTPQTPVGLSGFGHNLNRIADAVDTPLTGNVLTFEDKDGNRAALCGLDLHSVDYETVQRIQAQVAQAYGDRPAPVIALNGSHTHSGPATRMLHGAGGYNPEYIDQVLVPNLSNAIVEAFDNATDGEVGLARSPLEGVSINRTSDEEIDTRVTVIKVDTERLSVAGIHFACHPVVYDGKSKMVSGDFPVYARRALQAVTKNPNGLWLTGFAGEINPIRQAESAHDDVKAIGDQIGQHAAEVLKDVKTAPANTLRAENFFVEVPINANFKLDIDEELEIFREVRKLPKTADITPFQSFIEQVEPIVSASHDRILRVPAVIISIGDIAFAGFGAEIYSSTGRMLEAAQPGVKLITTMTTNEETGYIPPAYEYDRNAYSAHGSAFIFGRKPLTRDSEAIFSQQAIGKLDEITRQSSL